MPEVHIRYYASARAAADTESESLSVDGNATVSTVLKTLRDRHGEALGRIIDVAGFLLDGVAVRDRNATVDDGCTLDVLPPFAGG